MPPLGKQASLREYLRDSTVQVPTVIRGDQGLLVAEALNLVV